jgi:hypothetical protein
MRRSHTTPPSARQNDPPVRQLDFQKGPTGRTGCPLSLPSPRARSQQPPALLAVARRASSASPPVAFEEKEWISIFQLIHRLLSHLHRDRTHIEIVHYLEYVEMALALAGYRGVYGEIVTRFGTLFPQLGFQAAKGRDARKFVYVQDVFGKHEPFALLKLECENG